MSWYKEQWSPEDTWSRDSWPRDGGFSEPWQTEEQRDEERQERLQEVRERLQSLRGNLPVEAAKVYKALQEALQQQNRPSGARTGFERDFQVALAGQFEQANNISAKQIGGGNQWLVRVDRGPRIYCSVRLEVLGKDPSLVDEIRSTSRVVKETLLDKEGIWKMRLSKQAEGPHKLEAISRFRQECSRRLEEPHGHGRDRDRPNGSASAADNFSGQEALQDVLGKKVEATFTCEGCSNEWTSHNARLRPGGQGVMAQYCSRCGTKGRPMKWQEAEDQEQEEDSVWRRKRGAHQSHLCEACKEFGSCTGIFYDPFVVSTALCLATRDLITWKSYSRELPELLLADMGARYDNLQVCLQPHVYMPPDELSDDDLSPPPRSGPSMHRARSRGGGDARRPPVRQTRQEGDYGRPPVRQSGRYEGDYGRPPVHQARSYEGDYGRPPVHQARSYEGDYGRPPVHQGGSYEGDYGRPPLQQARSYAGPAAASPAEPQARPRSSRRKSNKSGGASSSASSCTWSRVSTCSRVTEAATPVTKPSQDSDILPTPPTSSFASEMAAGASSLHRPPSPPGAGTTPSLALTAITGAAEAPALTQAGGPLETLPPPPPLPHPQGAISSGKRSNKIGSKMGNKIQSSTEEVVVTKEKHPRLSGLPPLRRVQLLQGVVMLLQSKNEPEDTRFERAERFLDRAESNYSKAYALLMDEVHGNEDQIVF